jgi:hypothetical protein
MTRPHRGIGFVPNSARKLKLSSLDAITEAEGGWVCGPIACARDVVDPRLLGPKTECLGEFQDRLSKMGVLAVCPSRFTCRGGDCLAPVENQDSTEAWL